MSHSSLASSKSSLASFCAKSPISMSQAAGEDFISFNEKEEDFIAFNDDEEEIPFTLGNERQENRKGPQLESGFDTTLPKGFFEKLSSRDGPSRDGPAREYPQTIKDSGREYPQPNRGPAREYLSHDSLTPLPIPPWVNPNRIYSKNYITL